MKFLWFILSLSFFFLTNQASAEVPNLPWRLLYLSAPVQVLPFSPGLTAPIRPLGWSIPDSVQLTLIGLRQSGTLHRPLDPTTQNSGIFSFVGRRHLSPHQLLYFQVQYATWQQQGVARAIELEPYADDPLVLQDSTDGNFQHGWLQFSTQYFHRLGKRWIPFVGVYYQVGQGLKNQYTRPRILRRSFQWQSGIQWQLSPHWQWIFTFQGLQWQEQTEIEKSRIDFQDPLVYRFRSAGVYRPFLGEFTRYVTLTQYTGWIAMRWVGRMTIALTGMQEHMVTIDRTTLEFPDTPWYRQGFSVFLKTAQWSLFPKLQLILRATGGHRSGWSQHPAYPLLIMERTVQWATVTATTFWQRLAARFPYVAVRLRWHYLSDQAMHYQKHISEQGILHQFQLRVNTGWKINPIRQIGGQFYYGMTTQPQASLRFFPEFEEIGIGFHFQEQRATHQWRSSLNVRYFWNRTTSWHRWVTFLKITVGFQLPPGKGK